MTQMTQIQNQKLETKNAKPGTLNAERTAFSLLPLQKVYLINRNGLAISIHCDNDTQSDRRLCCGHNNDEYREHRSC